jgi:hypothetical protein
VRETSFQVTHQSINIQNIRRAKKLHTKTANNSPNKRHMKQFWKEEVRMAEDS